ncbi:hypothetical protein [Bacillus cihuensis]|uniref:hypothetical protein n=1 Tax=Bacillus cihuensis TaxID=1208599 RepID=UPI00048B6F80|nr:hypothetical protein [Bacillus cihuensis]
MAVWILGTFIKTSVFYYASVLSTAQWLNLSDYRPIVFPIGILIVIFSFWGFPSVMSLSRYDIFAYFYYLSIQTLIPLILLLIAVSRKKINKKNQKTI